MDSQSHFILFLYFKDAQIKKASKLVQRIKPVNEIRQQSRNKIRQQPKNTNTLSQQLKIQKTTLDSTTLQEQMQRQSKRMQEATKKHVKTRCLIYQDQTF